MALNFYPATRGFLFGMDPESAHERTMHWLERGQNTPLQFLWSQPRVDDPVEIAGLRFPNRVGLAAGLDKNARCLDAFAAMGFGFVEVGTVTPRPQPGNARPRMFRLQTHRALINRLGFNNEGVQAFIDNVRKSRLFGEVGRKMGTNRPILGLNIGKNATTPIEQAHEDYTAALAAVYPWADYVTVNISSPNTQNLRTLQSDAALDALLAAISQERARLQAQSQLMRPIFLKIAPDLNPEQIQVIAATVRRHAIDGLIATNTTIDRATVAAHPHASETGGLSGAPLLQASNAVIAQLRAALGAGFPIIGVGGVMSAEDARAKLRAGADLVQIYTGLIYEGPALIPAAAHALKQEAAQLRSST